MDGSARRPEQQPQQQQRPHGQQRHSSTSLSKYDAYVTRMGMIGRQKRALKFQLNPSPSTTPSMTPALAGDLGQPSYFSRETSHSREHSRRTSGNRSDSADSDALQAMFRR